MVDARLYQRASLGTWIVSTERSQPHRTALVALPVGLGHAWDMVWRLQCCSSWGPADVALQRNGYAGAWEGEAVGTTTLHILNLLQETCGIWGCSVAWLGSAIEQHKGCGCGSQEGWDVTRRGWGGRSLQGAVVSAVLEV